MTKSEQKKSIRKELLYRLRKLDSIKCAVDSQTVVERILALPAYQQAERVMLYLNMPGEVSLDGVATDALRQGKKVYVPVCLGKEQPSIMEAGRLMRLDAVVQGPLSIRTLAPGYTGVLPSSLDLVLIPGVAFDEQGHRLGRGAGYYDRFLGKINILKRYGIAWEYQLMPTVPIDEHDKLMGTIITEQRRITIYRENL